MVSFRGEKKKKKKKKKEKLGPRPDWSPLGFQFKLSDEHTRPFHIGVLPSGDPVTTAIEKLNL